MELIKLRETGWNNKDLVPDCQKIKKITSQLDVAIKDMRKVKPKLSKNDIAILFNNITQVLAKWTGDTYVGCKKDDRLKDAFQIFFDKLYEFLLIYKDKCKLAEQLLYHGQLYRYLGHSSGSKDTDSKIEPKYNDIWVSWSKNDVRKISYLKSKLYGTKTILICETKYKMGIDLTGFDKVFETHLTRGEEAEVVYPTLEDTIIDIEYEEEMGDE